MLPGPDVPPETMHNRSVIAATDISFPPNDLTLNLMPTLLVSQKSKERTGCQLVLPLPRIRKMLMRRLQEVRVQTPWGQGCTYDSGERCKPLVEVDLLAHEHPAFHPRFTYYNGSVIKLISLFEANFTKF